MLTEDRYERILELVNENGSVTVSEICDLLEVSESTARRDIVALDQNKKLQKVFGGAVALEHTMLSAEPTVAQKLMVNEAQKRRIARKAVECIEAEDVVYLDAGTSTGYMIDYINDKSVRICTNSISHAKTLAKKGYKVVLLGGEVKGTTEAIIGSQAMKMLETFHFTKGFFGSNGITKEAGFTTPDSSEALIKELAMKQCRQCFVLADSDKFDVISSVTFAKYTDATIITEATKKAYSKWANIITA
ncbi:MAG: DeoR/GlpR transcriptional regulator [Pseudobutyrivibrio sp.]|nr:DeoR/GlpR transcriptional regulator [Pseudobutyrivibrio sp.]